MASSRGPLLSIATVVALLAGSTGGLTTTEARGGASPLVLAPPADPDACSVVVEQEAMVHVFDTSDLPGGPFYVNDHSLVQARDGAWHLFGIFHHEPIGAGAEVDLIHAVTGEPDPAKWTEGSFVVAPRPHGIALHADPDAGETHLWAPHVVPVDGRYVMIYQGGGADDYHASIRLAESDDLYRWSRIGSAPVFEDFCEARDPMLVRRDDAWVVYYTRCESVAHKVSGVAYRLSRDLVHWGEPHVVLSVASAPPTSNSAYTESPFVFERNGMWFLTVSAYPLAWDATLVYRSPAPFAFPDAPITRLRAHAAEWVFGKSGAVWLTHAGPGQRGVWLARVRGL